MMGALPITALRSFLIPLAGGFMRRFVFLTVICSLLGLIAMPAFAGDSAAKVAKKTRTVIGMVKSADATSVTISVVKKKGEKVKDRTIKITKETTITVDGKAATLAALTSGVSVKITLSHGHTDQIDVTTTTTDPTDPTPTKPAPTPTTPKS
jgi:hypothetical protein